MTIAVIVREACTPSTRLRPKIKTPAQDVLVYKWTFENTLPPEPNRLARSQFMTGSLEEQT